MHVSRARSLLPVPRSLAIATPVRAQDTSGLSGGMSGGMPGSPLAPPGAAGSSQPTGLGSYGAISPTNQTSAGRSANSTASATTDAFGTIRVPIGGPADEPGQGGLGQPQG